jgi:hypothetical protein
MSKVLIMMLILIILIITYSLCVATQRWDQQPEECKYNILEGCKGKCCKNCELEGMCKLACRDDSENCGGRVNY